MGNDAALGLDDAALCAMGGCAAAAEQGGANGLGAGREYVTAPRGAGTNRLARRKIFHVFRGYRFLFARAASGMGNMVRADESRAALRRGFFYPARRGANAAQLVRRAALVLYETSRLAVHIGRGRGVVIRYGIAPCSVFSGMPTGQ